jgi:hypothetical protein
MLFVLAYNPIAYCSLVLNHRNSIRVNYKGIKANRSASLSPSALDAVQNQPYLCVDNR